MSAVTSVRYTLYCTGDYAVLKGTDDPTLRLF
jgi:hypothetical protein